MALTSQQLKLKNDLEQYLVDLGISEFVANRFVTKEQLISQTTAQIAELIALE